MALQIHLPLNGNLTNQGAATVTVTANGTTSYTTGRNGTQALNCNGSSNWKITGYSLGNTASIACWTKTSTNGKMSWVLESAVSNYLNFYESTVYTLNTGDGNNNPFKTSNGKIINCMHDNAWHHFVVTFDGSSAKLYIDGGYYGTAQTYKSPAKGSASGTIKLGGDYNATHNYDWNGQLSDFRVYDNVLTADEISILSEKSSATTKTVTYKNKVIDDSVMTDFYNRLNTLRTAGGATALTVPSLVGTTVTAAQVKTDLFNAITTTKSDVSFLSGLTLPYAQPDATIGSLIRASVFQNAAGTTVARAEKNIGTMEAACRNFCSTNISGWNVNHSAKTVGSWSANHSAKSASGWRVNCYHTSRSWNSDKYFQGFSSTGSWGGNCYGHAGYADGNPCWCGSGGNCASNGRWASWGVNCASNAASGWSVNFTSNSPTWSVNCSQNTISGWSNNALTFSANNTTFTVEGLDFN